MPPGMTIFPAAWISFAAPAAKAPGAAIAAIVSPAMATSAVMTPCGVTTSPPRMMRSSMRASPCQSLLPGRACCLGVAQPKPRGRFRATGIDGGIAGDSVPGDNQRIICSLDGRATGASCSSGSDTAQPVAIALAYCTASLPTSPIELAARRNAAMSLLRPVQADCCAMGATSGKPKDCVPLDPFRRSTCHPREDGAGFGSSRHGGVADDGRL